METRLQFHSVPPDVNQIIWKIQEIMNSGEGYEKVFVATEDKKIFNHLYDYYRDRMIFCETGTRIESAEGKWLNNLFDSSVMKNMKRQAIQEYLREIYILTRCDALIAPVIGGTLGAVRIRGGYEKQYFFDLGLYK